MIVQAILPSEPTVHPQPGQRRGPAGQPGLRLPEGLPLPPAQLDPAAVGLLQSTNRPLAALSASSLDDEIKYLSCTALALGLVLFQRLVLWVTLAVFKLANRA